MTTPPYTKLPGKARTLVTTSRLWLGGDHILLVKSTRVVEEYRRFYFPDVQAIVIRRTMPFHYAWAVVLSAAVLLTARLSGSVFASLAVLAVSAVFLWFRGPACICHLYTAVQAERLPSLHRLKTAQRVVQILRTQIEQQQGTLSAVPDDLPPPLPGPPPLPNLPAQVESAVPASIAPHLTLFTVMLVSAGLAALAMFAPSAWSRVAAALASLTEFVFLVPVLAWQAGKRLSRELKVTTWAGVIRWMLVQTPAWAIQYKAALVDKTSRDLGPWLLPVAQGWIGWLNLTSLLLVGVVGFYFACRNSR